MPDTEFNSVEPVRFIPSDGAAPPLRDGIGQRPDVGDRDDVLRFHRRDRRTFLVGNVAEFECALGALESERAAQAWRDARVGAHKAGRGSNGKCRINAAKI